MKRLTKKGLFLLPLLSLVLVPDLIYGVFVHRVCVREWEKQ